MASGRRTGNLIIKHRYVAAAGGAGFWRRAFALGGICQITTHRHSRSGVFLFFCIDEICQPAQLRDFPLLRRLLEGIKLVQDGQLLTKRLEASLLYTVVFSNLGVHRHFQIVLEHGPLVWVANCGVHALDTNCQENVSDA